MGYRNITRNEFGHQSHLFVAHDSKRQRRTDTRVILSCWCGEVVQEVRN